MCAATPITPTTAAVHTLHMEILFKVLQVVIPVFTIAAIGFGYGLKYKPDMRSFNKVSVDVFSVCLIYTALADKNFELQRYWPILGAAFFIMFATGLLAWPLARLTGIKAQTLVPVVMFNNTANTGLPLALLAFEPQNFGAAVSLFAATCVAQFALGPKLLNPQAGVLKSLWNPLLIAAGLGFFSHFSGLRPPVLMFSGMELMGKAALPMMLFSLGVRLTALRWADVGAGFVGALARPILGLLVAIPLVWVMQHAMGIALSPEARGQILLYAALPPAAMIFIMAERYYQGATPQSTQQEVAQVGAMVLLGNAIGFVFISFALALSL